MRTTPDPRLIESSGTETEAKISYGPFLPGRAATIGHALRRTLLSSLPGCFIESVRIAGVNHKYATLNGMQEDVMTLVQKLKKVNWKVNSTFVDKVKLRIDVRGPATVTSKMITYSDESNSEVISVLNDVHLATLSQDGHLQCDIYVRRGYGYVDSHNSNDNPSEIQPGRILVNNVAGSVLAAGINVVQTRFGDRTDYEILEISVKTDGSIAPVTAVESAAAILVRQFGIIAGELDTKGGSDRKSEVNKENLSKPVAHIGLSDKTVEALHLFNIQTVGDLINCTEAYLLEIPRFGKRKIQDIQAALAPLRLTLKDARIVSVEKDV